MHTVKGSTTHKRKTSTVPADCAAAQILMHGSFHLTVRWICVSAAVLYSALCRLFGSMKRSKDKQYCKVGPLYHSAEKVEGLFCGSSEERSGLSSSHAAVFPGDRLHGRSLESWKEGGNFISSPGICSLVFRLWTLFFCSTTSVLPLTWWFHCWATW